MQKKAILEISDAAAERVKELLAARGKPSLGVRVGVKSGGCNGLSYFVEYADEKNKFDEEISDKGVVILVDPKAVIYLLGSKMDYVEEDFKKGFAFVNPNQKGSCGCGESFNV